MSYKDPTITTNDIKAISSLTGSDLSVFVEMAIVLVDDNLLDKNLSDGLLRLICKNLAAHFAFLKEGQLKSETLGPVSETFNITTGLGLNATTFGQQAIMLDSSKTLAKLNDPDRKVNKPTFEML